jgi:hypothetical protein
MLTAGLGGCVSYSSTEVASMSTYEMCALQVNQWPTLTDSSRQLLQSELGRRKDDCAPHMRRIQAERDELMYELTYRNQSP